MVLLKESATPNKVYKTISNPQSLQNVFTYKSGSADSSYLLGDLLQKINRVNIKSLLELVVFV